MNGQVSLDQLPAEPGYEPPVPIPKRILGFPTIRRPIQDTVSVREVTSLVYDFYAHVRVSNQSTYVTYFACCSSLMHGNLETSDASTATLLSKTYHMQ